MECLFCNIAQRKTPAEVVYKNAGAIAFLDSAPRSPGHTIVVPMSHAATILELPDNEISPLFGAVKETASLIKDALDPAGFTIGINHGAVSGQAVEHLHVHVIPRFNGDGGSSIHAVVENPPQESLAEIGERIRNAYDQSENKIQ